MDFLQKIIEVRKSHISGTLVKGSKAEGKYDDFTKGALVRIKLENFLPYDFVELFPGPYLNLIIGPNGSGKSALVCGICLGLGGKVSTIGRATQLTDFIKRGCKKAFIEVELYNPYGKNWVIWREISCNSSWKLNGRQVSKKEVDEMLNELSIQVDNLCQFLPQDRVADFAKMSQQDLLLNTERAVGSRRMYECHLELKDLRNQARDFLAGIGSLDERLKAEKERKGQLDIKVQNYNEREIRLENVKILKRKRKWIEYEEANLSYMQQNEHHKSLLKEQNNMQATDEPFLKELKELDNTMRDLSKESSALLVTVRDFSNKIANGKKRMQDLVQTVVEIDDRLKNSIHNEETRRHKEETMKQQLEALENEFSKTINVQEDVQPLIVQVDKECQVVTMELLKLRDAKENITAATYSLGREKTEVEQELKNFKDVRLRRLEILRQKHKHTYDAAVWLQNNKDKFKREIFEPIMVLINVNDQKYIKYVEAHIPFNDMIAFVCEDPEDINLFMSTMRDSQNLKINAVLAPQEGPDKFRPAKSIAEYKKWGFFSYLKDLFTAPNAVMAYLCQLYNIHNIPVGNEDSEKYVEDIVVNAHFGKFYTSNSVYMSKRSLYGNRNISSMTFELRVPTLLTVFIDRERMQELEAKLQSLEDKRNANRLQLLQMHEQEKELALKQEANRNKKKELLKKRDAQKTLVAQIKQKKESIQILQEQAINIEEEKVKASEKTLKITKDRCKLLNNLCADTKNCFCQNMLKVQTSVKQAEMFSKRLDLEQKHKEIKFAMQQLQSRINQSQLALNTKREEAKHLWSIANKERKVENTLTKSVSTLEEIDELICMEQAKVDCLALTDDGVIQEHLKKQQIIHDLEKKVARKNTELTKLEEEITYKKELWLPELENLIEKINANFSRYFAAMGCAGEVTLSKSENPEEFDKYGLTIKVRYRLNEELKELAQTYHSGGECSVATAIYMIALQTLTKVPFRCVDEINQGMDPENERKVFNFIVNTACHENSAQYFLLTPKLLPHLKYSTKTKIHVIHSGTKSLNCT